MHVARSAAAIGVIATVVVVGWPMPVGTTLALGLALLMWIVGNFALERPDR